MASEQNIKQTLQDGNKDEVSHSSIVTVHKSLISCSSSRSTTPVHRSKIPVSRFRVGSSSSRDSFATDKAKLKKEVLHSKASKFNRSCKENYNSESSDTDTIRAVNQRNLKLQNFVKNHKIEEAAEDSHSNVFECKLCRKFDLELSETCGNVFENDRKKRNKINTSKTKTLSSKPEVSEIKENSQNKQKSTEFSDKESPNKESDLFDEIEDFVQFEKQLKDDDSLIDNKSGVKNNTSDIYMRNSKSESGKVKEISSAEPEYLHNSVNKLNEIIKALLSEKAHMEDSIQNLQEKLYQLEMANEEHKKTVQEYKEKYETLLEEKEMHQDNFTQTRGSFVGLEIASSKLCAVNKDISSLYDHLAKEYEKNKEIHEKMKENLTAEITKLTLDIEERSKAYTELQKTLTNKESEIRKLQCRNDECLQKQLKPFTTLKKNFSLTRYCQTEAERKIISKELETELEKAKKENLSNQENISQLFNELNTLQKELDEIMNDKKKEQQIYENRIQNLMAKHESEKICWMSDVDKFNREVESLNTKLSNEENSRNQLSKVHKELAEKLLRAVKLLIDEKLARQSADMKVVQFSQRILALESDKHLSEHKIESMAEETCGLKCKLDELINDKRTLQEVIVKLQSSLRKSENRFTRLENQIRKIKQKKISSFQISNFEKSINNLELNKDSLIESLKINIEKCQNVILEYKHQVSSLEKKITKLEFQRCETSIRCHELNWKLNRELLLNEKLQQVMERILVEIRKMKNDGTLSKDDADSLLYVTREQFERFENSDGRENAVPAITQ